MPKSRRAVLDEHVELLEGARVEQELDALAGGQLAAAVLRLDALLAAAEARLRAPCSSCSITCLITLPFRPAQECVEVSCCPSSGRIVKRSPTRP